MTTTQIEIQLIAVLVAVACAMPGVFLVLRRMAMMSDAISHTVLLGIVLTFFITRSLESPWLMVGAAVMGVLTVSLVEALNNTRLVKQDAAIGLVFPALFSIAVILISRYASGVHLDADAVLLGELAFAPFKRMELFGIDLPHAVVAITGILIIQGIFFTLLYKELKLATFDPALAATLGFVPGALHYGLMGVVSITAVGAFDVVGSVLVIALMIAPAAAAYLLTNRLGLMVAISAGIGAGSAISGYWLARLLDANIAGAMATTTGVFFLVAFLFAPGRGVIAVANRRINQKWAFAQTVLTIHLLNHEDKAEALQENRVNHLGEHLHWDGKFAAQVVQKAIYNDLITRSGDFLHLTEYGRQSARRAMIK